jgi:hypothetical protein
MPFTPPLRATANAALALLIISALLLQSALAQDSGKGGRDDARPFDPISFQGRDEFEISDPAQVPRQVARAAEQAGCHYIDQITDHPLRFLKIDWRRLVLVYCNGIIGTHQVFDLEDMRRPQRLEFPVMSAETGFGTTHRPGMITWNKDLGVFEAQKGSDLCPSPRIRHVYRLSGKESGFVLIRIGLMKDGCGDGSWSTIWEAPKWSELAGPR